MVLLTLATLAMPTAADHVDDLISDLKYGTSNIRRSAVFELSHPPVDARAVDPLIVALKDENWSVRYSAAESLAYSNDPRAVGPLTTALKDENEFVRSMVATALGEIGDARAVDPLIWTLEDDRFPVRAAAIRALGKIGDPGAIGPIIDISRKESRWQILDTAAQALREFGVNPPQLSAYQKVKIILYDRFVVHRADFFVSATPGHPGVDELLGPGGT